MVVRIASTCLMNWDFGVAKTAGCTVITKVVSKKQIGWYRASCVPLLDVFFMEVKI